MITSTKFRKELVKIMPGYKWTIHRPYTKDSKFLIATGIQTAGLNRVSTLEVTVKDQDGKLYYTSRSSGCGKNSQWLSSNEGSTLARSLRGLQDHYEIHGNNYLRHAADLQGARVKQSAKEE